MSRSAPPAGDTTGRLYSGLALSRLPGLDGIRAIAAAMVVINHHDFTFVSGTVGVTLFFVLSGFLITWLLLAEDDRHGSVSLRNFYARRSLRIFPAFYAYCALVFVLAVLTHKQLPAGQAIASLFYVNNYYEAIHGEIASPLSHSWSLGIEEQFYLLWPMAFLVLRRDRARMARALAATIAVVWVYRAALSAAGAPWYYIHYAFDTRADHLLIGCLLAVVLKERMCGRAIGFLTDRPGLSVVTALLLVLSMPASRRFGTGYEQTIGFAVQPVIIAVLIVQIIAFRESALWRWTNARWMVYLGTISYSTYLYQQIVPGPVMRSLGWLPAGAQLLVSFTIIIALASASYYVIERPFLRLKERFAAKRRAERVLVYAEAGSGASSAGVS
jgi:peptidoglycan/LPS O-acetylase OafA/YrhL